MRRKDNMTAVEEMRKSLSLTKKKLFEDFVVGDAESPYDEGVYEPEEDFEALEEKPVQDEHSFSADIKDAIVKIRKISIGVIAKLADNPTSESYTFMKRVLDMSDKALESMKNNEMQPKK